MTIRKYASKLNVNVCSNVLIGSICLYVFMDEIIKSEYYIILYNMLHIHLRCEMSAHIISKNDLEDSDITCNSNVLS